MDDAFGVSRSQSVRNLDAQIEHQADVDRSAADAMFQRLAFQQFHGDERLPVRLADIVDGADVRVIESGRSAGFSLKAVQRLTVPGHFGWEEFEGDVAAEAGILGFVDHTHSAAT